MQDVVEISVESMRDVQGGAAGVSCIDFRAPAGTRAGSKQVSLTFITPGSELQMQGCVSVLISLLIQGEAKRFLAALCRRAEQSGDNMFSVHQLFDLSDHLQLKVPDMREFIDQLNEAGKSGYACACCIGEEYL